MPSLDILSEVIEIKQDAISKIYALIENDFDKAVDILSNCKGKVVISGIGKSGHIGKKISSTLSSLGIVSIFLHPSEASHGDLGVINPGDVCVLISNSGNSKELEDVVGFLNLNNISYISITKNKKSLIGKNANIVLQLPDTKEACSIGLAPTTSTTSTLVIGDALSIAVSTKRGITDTLFKRNHPGGKLGQNLLKVEDIMHTDYPKIESSAMVKDALTVMEKYRFGCVGVFNGKKLNGIFTDGDLLRKYSIIKDGDTINKHMNVDPYFVKKGDYVNDVKYKFHDCKVSALFVVDEEENVVGIVHFHDIKN